MLSRRILNNFFTGSLFIWFFISLFPLVLVRDRSVASSGKCNSVETNDVLFSGINRRIPRTSPYIRATLLVLWRAAGETRLCAIVRTTDAWYSTLKLFVCFSSRKEISAIKQFAFCKKERQLLHNLFGRTKNSFNSHFKKFDFPFTVKWSYSEEHRLFQ